MKLVSAQITGFQSFGDTGLIEFGDGINLIVGQNNAGKSALLRALSGQMSNDPHRTPQLWRQELLQPPQTELGVEVSTEELQLSIARTAPAQFPAPIEVDAIDFAKEILARKSLIVHFLIEQNGYGSKSHPCHRLFDPSNHGPQHCAIISYRQGTYEYTDENTSNDNLYFLVGEFWRMETFYFTAERMSIGEGNHSYAVRLAPNAQNLPAVLHTLNGDRGDVFRKLIDHLREVFPTVGNLSVRPRPENSNQLEIRVWPTVEMAQVALSFPLNQSGTGVSQVIALLTAIMTVENSVVIIDEINSFLHPAAVKALLRILQAEYPQHQYIISTHSPEVISFSNPSTVHLVTRDGYESTVTKLDLEQLDQFRQIAEHLGISMADVFAADRVIWVEGPTEELCFPLIYKHATGRSLPRGTIFTSVVATGDFVAKKRDRTLIYEIYSRLSTATNPLVTTAAFSFDSEELSDQEKQDMGRTSGGLVQFLPRRHLECYLVDAMAIAVFIRSKDSELAAVTEADVNRSLQALAADRFRVPEWNNDVSDPNWLSKVDAAKLIKAVCLEVSEQRVSFEKKSDTLFLLKQVLQRDADSLGELCAYVEGLVKAEA